MRVGLMGPEHRLNRAWGQRKGQRARGVLCQEPPARSVKFVVLARALRARTFASVILCLSDRSIDRAKDIQR
jgi:hypothetical protein